MINSRQQSEDNDLKLSELEKELADLRDDGGRLLQELEAHTKQEQELKLAIETQQQEAIKLDQQREIYFKECTKHQKNYQQANEDGKRFFIML